MKKLFWTKKDSGVDSSKGERDRNMGFLDKIMDYLLGFFLNPFGFLKSLF